DLLGLIVVRVARRARRRDAEDQHEKHPDDHPSTHTSHETIAPSPTIRERAPTLRDSSVVGRGPPDPLPRHLRNRGYTRRVGMARAERARRWGRGRSVAPFLGALLALAAVAGGTYLLVTDRSSTQPSSAPAPSAATPSGPTGKPLAGRALALQGLQGRALLSPECAPLKGPRWVYPVAPPVRGLPNIVANIKSDLYEVFAINYSCKEASAW